MGTRFATTVRLKVENSLRSEDKNGLDTRILFGPRGSVRCYSARRLIFTIAFFKRDRCYTCGITDQHAFFPCLRLIVSLHRLASREGARRPKHFRCDPGKRARRRTPHRKRKGFEVIAPNPSAPWITEPVMSPCSVLVVRATSPCPPRLCATPRSLPSHRGSARVRDP